MRTFSLKALLAVGVATLGFTTLCLAAMESRLPLSQLLRMEGIINDRLRSNFNDPYDLLGAAHGSYLDGYGVVFTVELGLTNVPQINPFRPTFTPAELGEIHDHKARKMPIFRDALRNLMLGAATTLDSLPPGEHVAIDAILFNYSFENARDLPKRILMVSSKNKLLEAQAKHADLTTVIEEQER